MPENQIVPHSQVSILGIRLSEEFLQSVVDSVMEAYHTDKPSVGKLKKAINENLVISGFSRGKTTMANPSQIRRALSVSWDKFPRLKKAVIAVWGDMHADALVQGKKWYLSHPDVKEELAGSKHKDGIQETVFSIDTARQILKELAWVASPEEIELVMIHVLDQAGEYEFVRNEKKVLEKRSDTPPALEFPLVEQVNPQVSPWEDILELIRPIPVDDPRWAVVAEFTTMVESIAAEKAQDLDANDQLKAVNELWTQSRSVLLEKSAYFDVPGVEDWAIQQVNREDINDITGNIGELVQQLSIFNQLDLKPASETRAERVKRDKDRQDTEEKIQGLYQALKDKLFPVAGETPGIEAAPSAPDEDNKKDEQPGPGEMDLPQAGQAPDVPPQNRMDTPQAAREIETTDALLADSTSTVDTPEEQPADSVGAVLGEVVEISLDEEAIPDTTTPVVPTAPALKGAATGQTEQDLIDTQDLDPVQTEIVKLLKARNLSRAYWLDWGLEKNGKTPPIPSWLVAAVQGATWSIGLWPEQPAGFMDSIVEIVQPQERILNDGQAECAWMQFAAGLYFSLVDMGDKWDGWLNVDLPAGALALNQLQQDIYTAHSHGTYLDPTLVELVVNTESVNQYIQSLSDEARELITNAGTRRAKLLRMGQVWQDIMRPPKGDLYKMIKLVADDRREEAANVRSQLSQWQDRASIDRLVQKIDLTHSKIHSRPIVGSALEQVIGWINTVCKVAGDWSSTVIKQEEAQKGQNWSLNQVRDFCENTNALLVDVRKELEELGKSITDANARVSLETLKWVLDGIHGMISPEGRESLVSWDQPTQHKRVGDMLQQTHILDNLTHALHYYPELKLDNEGLPDLLHIQEFVDTLVNKTARTADDAILGWIESQDYRFIYCLLNEVKNPELWNTRCREALQGQLAQLEKEEMEYAIVAIEQALQDGLIAEGEHTDLDSQIQSIQKQIRLVDKNNPEWASNGKICMDVWSKRLYKIQNILKGKRSDRLKTQQKHWNDIKQDLGNLVGDDQNFREIIENALEKSIRDEDLRTTGEYLAQLADGKLPARSLFEGRQSTDANALVEFQESLPNYVTLLEPRSPMSFAAITNALVKDDPLPRIPRNSMASLPGPTRKEIGQALDAWRWLKVNGAEGKALTQFSNLVTVLRYLGFSIKDPSPVSTRPLPGGMPNFQHWRVAAQVGSFSPVAQFGSQRMGYYDVIGVWDRPGPEIISSQVSSLMQQTGNQPAILLYFHYLTSTRRDILLTTARRSSLPMLVIDEALVLFLAREADTRVKSMFYCTLPYASLNPYFPSAAGLVPPEVFKGRREHVINLTNPQGPAIVYGGRQLGKSALLRQVEKEFDHPENGQFAIYEDVKSVGDPVSEKNYQLDLRDRLAQALVNRKLLEPQRISLDLDRLLNHLQQNLILNNRKMILLLDEADHLLDADAKKNFLVISKLKDLMGKSEGRFKIVLAGLHNVQRFQRIPNQPLAHLGTPIKIGPLEPVAARQLLVEPLHALGFRFGNNPEKEDVSLVLHILSYTNYHPGLIQLFGNSLVDHLLGKNYHTARPPFPITRSDVEFVYRKKEVREAIIDRFNWTLALDPRYEVITLALILEQWDEQNGFDRLYSPKKLRESVEAWWPEGFNEEVTPERFKGFLDEMQGLGVLSVSQDGNYYRLRSPNLVTLMGSHDQIEEKMSTLISSRPPGEGDLESYHAFLENGAFSPLSFSEERLITNPRSGVVLVFGTGAAGFNNLEPALKRLTPAESGVMERISIAAHNSEAMKQQLTTFMRQYSQSASFMIVLRKMDGDADRMAEEVMGAVQFCNQVKSKYALRVCLSFDSQSTWQWYQLPAAKREEIEEKVETVISLRRWDRLGIKQRLEMGEIILHDRHLPKLMDVTGGWLTLLDEFIASCKGKEPSAVLETIKKELIAPESALSKSFHSGLGIYETLPQTVIAALKRTEIQEMLKESQSFLEVLSLGLEDQSPEEIENVVNYLSRLSIINLEPCLMLEPAVSRVWHES